MTQVNCPVVSVAPIDADQVVRRDLTGLPFIPLVFPDFADFVRVIGS